MTMGYILKVIVSDWYFVYGRNKKIDFINSIKFNIFVLFEWINVKLKLNLFICENEFIDISSKYIHRIKFTLPTNPRIDKMKMDLWVSNTMNGVNPYDRVKEKRLILTLNKSEWDSFRHELNKVYSDKTLENFGEIQNY